MDDGGDWEYELEQEYAQRDQEVDRVWRKRLPSLDRMVAMLDAGQTPSLDGIQTSVRSMGDIRRAEIEAGESMEIPTFSMND